MATCACQPTAGRHRSGPPAEERRKFKLKNFVFERFKQVRFSSQNSKLDCWNSRSRRFHQPYLSNCPLTIKPSFAFQIQVLDRSLRFLAATVQPNGGPQLGVVSLSKQDNSRFFFIIPSGLFQTGEAMNRVGEIGLNHVQSLSSLSVTL